MKIIFWYSNLFIYLIEQVHPFALQVEQVVAHMRQEQTQLVTSALTVCETLVKPVREQRDDLVSQYRELFAKIPIVSIEPTLAPFFAEIRSSGGIKTHDALQLACALQSSATCFLTNDRRLSSYTRPGLSVFSLQDYLAQ